MVTRARQPEVVVAAAKLARLAGRLGGLSVNSRCGVSGVDSGPLKAESAACTETT